MIDREVSGWKLFIFSLSFPSTSSLLQPQKKNIKNLLGLLYFLYFLFFPYLFLFNFLLSLAQSVDDDSSLDRLQKKNIKNLLGFTLEEVSQTNFHSNFYHSTSSWCDQVVHSTLSSHFPHFRPWVFYLCYLKKRKKKKKRKKDKCSKVSHRLVSEFLIYKSR